MQPPLPPPCCLICTPPTTPYILRPGTPQCFLLTPKLLPGLPFNEAVTVLQIMNGALQRGGEPLAWLNRVLPGIGGSGRLPRRAIAGQVDNRRVALPLPQAPTSPTWRRATPPTCCWGAGGARPPSRSSGRRLPRTELASEGSGRLPALFTHVHNSVFSACDVDK